MTHRPSKETIRPAVRRHARNTHRSARFGTALVLLFGLNSSILAVVGGTEDLLNSYSSVGYVVTSNGISLSLGSVVALDANWVLTAAHVVDDPAFPPSFLVMGDPNGTEGVYFNDLPVIIHPDYVPGELHDDLALIRMSAITPIDPSFVPVSFATLSNADLGTGRPATATITGYGGINVDAVFDPAAPITRRFGAAPTDPFGPPPPPVDPGFPYDCSSGMLLCTYGTTGGAPGDSGGAMFVNYGGGEVVAGINSFIFDENDLLNPPTDPEWDDGYWTVSTSTAYYEAWITSHVPDAMFGAPVPIPPAVYLFGAGLIGVFGVNRRRAKH